MCIFSKRFNKKNTFKVNKIKNAENFKKKLINNLVLLYTGKQRTAQEIAKKFITNITSFKKKGN